MTREYKPGDVAMVTALNRPSGYRAYFGSDDVWHEAGRKGDSLFHPVSIRPLVVIDPEDREQVGRLTKVLLEAAHQHGNVMVSGNGIHPDTTADALREFANPTPPKPEEPTGLGAVVEDANGADWHRTKEGRWISADGLRTRAGGWGHIDAVRILSPGVIA